jgi:DNA-binding beta-propeller fold protein YncE
MKMKKTFSAVPFYVAMLFLLPSCEETFEPVKTVVHGKGLFICNEGNFTFGNASLSFYEIDSLKIQNQVFYNSNIFPVGDVLQSMSILDSIGFMVINNSGKILVFNTNSFKHFTTIGGLNSPRYIHFVNSNKAYVSDLYSKYITVIDPVNYEVIGSLYAGGSTEQMIMVGKYLFATSWSMEKQLYKIDTENDLLKDSLEVTLQPNSIVKDKNDMIWVLSDGAYAGSPAGQEIPALTLIEPLSFKVIHEFYFPDLESSPSKLTINGGGDTLYYILNSWSEATGIESGIYKMPVSKEELPSAPFIFQGSKRFYGLGIDPVTSEIYVSDALDYLQEGWVFRYNTRGFCTDSFRVDIAPGSFCFTEN